MGRWQPGTRERLTTAAMELYADHGYDGVTVAEIAARAGATERTFFRHFADKREVLFDGQAVLRDDLVAAVAGAPADASPWEAVLRGVRGLDAFFTVERLRWSRQRQVLLDANPALTEREVTKMAGLGGAVTEALVARGVPAGDAALLAEAGIGVFRVAFSTWLAEGDDRGFADLADEAAGSLRRLVAHTDLTGR